MAMYRDRDVVNDRDTQIARGRGERSFVVDLSEAENQGHERQDRLDNHELQHASLAQHKESTAGDRT